MFTFEVGVYLKGDFYLKEYGQYPLMSILSVVCAWAYVVRTLPPSMVWWIM